MPRQQEEIREINSYIQAWLLEIKISTTLSYTDINKVSEGTCLKLLNLIYGYELEDLDKEKKNFPAVDLGNSTSSKIAFQITSNTTKDKIRQSLKKFKKHNLDKRFTGGIKFLLLHGTKKTRTTIEGYEDIFDGDRDILYLSDLVREIAAIYVSDQERFFEIKEFLKFEFGNYNKKVKPLIFGDEADKVRHYLEVTLKSNAADVDNLVHFDVGRADSMINTEVLFEEPFVGKGAVITGESGHGKSLIIRSWAISLCNKDFVPVILEAKYCGSGLSVSIEKVALEYGFASALTFVKACRATGKKILLVIDGLNECTAETTERIIAELKELLRQYETLFLISTQRLTESLKALGAETIKVYKPDSKLKTAIAGKYSNSVNKLYPILDMVSTCMEARMVGEIGVFGVERISRYSLFELYVRRKLGPVDKDGIYLLSAFTRRMSQEISFSISLSQAEGIMHDSKIETTVLDSCLVTKLLVKDFARISFSHEMLLDFFTAASISRFNADFEAFNKEFNAPKNDGKKLLIIGAIEDPVIRVNVLESITDTKLILLLLEGEGGEASQYWAIEKLNTVLARISAETESIKFAIEVKDHPEVVIEAGSISVWSSDELAFAEAVVYQLMKGKLLKEVFLITSSMDNNLDTSFNNMLAEAREKKVGLRNGLFRAVYDPFNGSSFTVTGIATLFSSLNSGFISFSAANEISSEEVAELAGENQLKNGQFYLLLLFCRFSERSKVLFDLILKALTERWDYLPTVLRMEILNAVPYCHDREDQRLALIQAVENIHSKPGNPFLSSTLFDILSSLGALDDDAQNYEGTVQADLNAILSNPDDENSWHQAFYMFDNQFDHPYSSAFSTVLNGLDKSSERTFYTMALRHDDESDAFVKTLIFIAESVLGEACCPYLIKYTNREMIQTSMPQERLKTYIVVCLIFAKYRFPLTSSIKSTDDPAAKFLYATAELLYWINRIDLTDAEIAENSRDLIKIIFSDLSLYVVDGLKLFEHACYQSFSPETFKREEVKFINSCFANHLLAACRSSLKLRDARYVYNHFNNSRDVYRYAVDQIGLQGNSNDIMMLREIADDIDLGKNAVEAIMNIEKKS
ncbi:hypothetical protein SAMN05444671_4306 [Flavobacterium sp. CF108]|uniref:SMEK domain-containing protein n=1 Tax=Flavobacterium sp. CF108 TaxID=1882758 RepID=UPI000922C915|nr:SMEK domain-containing protein [Flavobacterium sp. CF108]SHH92440.1 hypothetical protein SAMN05444671_4306 [Flavobacterium sp. CF108]